MHGVDIPYIQKCLALVFITTKKYENKWWTQIEFVEKEQDCAGSIEIATGIPAKLPFAFVVLAASAVAVIQSYVCGDRLTITPAAEISGSDGVQNAIVGPRPHISTPALLAIGLDSNHVISDRRATASSKRRNHNGYNPEFSYSKCCSRRLGFSL
jgi:hypothetical protein